MKALLFALLGLSLSQQLPPITIAPGILMPAVSIGHPDDTPTSNCSHGIGPGCNATAQAMVEMWLAIGGVGVDTAFGYQSQGAVGAAIRASVANGTIPSRDAVFLTTKVNPKFWAACDAASALAAVQVDVQQLGVGRLDLVLQHFPCDSDAENAAAWQGLIAARRQNLTRAIGVSHFGAAQLEALVNATGVAPAVNQCGMYLGGHDDATIAYCEAHGITYEAYGALRDVDFGNAVLAAIAARHAVSAAQVALRFVTQFGGNARGGGHPLAVSPGTNVQYAHEDLELGAFALTDDDMAQLAAI